MLILLIFVVGHTNNVSNRIDYIAKECSNMKCSAYNSPINQFLRGNGGWDNFKLVVIGNVSCHTLLEVLQHKRIHFQTHNANLNTIVPSRTKQEWNKEHADQVQKHYITRNTKCTCECGGQYTHTHRSQHENTIKHQTFINALKTE